MKNIELCKKCFYGRIWETINGEVVGRSCELPPSVFINNNSKGLCEIPPLTLMFRSGGFVLLNS